VSFSTLSRQPCGAVPGRCPPWTAGSVRRRGHGPVRGPSCRHPLSGTWADAPCIVIAPGLQDGHGPVQAVQAPSRLGEGAALGTPAVEPPSDRTRWGASDGSGPRDISPHITVQLGKPQELPCTGPGQLSSGLPGKAFWIRSWTIGSRRVALSLLSTARRTSSSGNHALSERKPDWSPG